MQYSIRTRLAITFVTLAASLLLLVGVVLAWQSFVMDRQRAVTLQTELASRISLQVVSYIQLQENALKEIIQVQGLGNLDRDRQTELLSELLSFTDAFETLTLLNSAGQEQVVVSRTDVVYQLGDRSTNDEFIIPKSNSQIYFSPVQFSEKTGEPFLSISVPNIDVRSGKVTSVLLANVRFKPVWDLLANISLGEGSNAYIVDTQNRVVAHNNPSVVLRNTFFKVPNQGGIHIGAGGNNVVLAADKVTLGTQEFTVVVETPISEAFAGIYRTEITIALLLLVSVAMASGLSWLAARQIVGPIEELATIAKQIALGDLSHKANVQRKDEIGTLGIAFNQMTEQLQGVLTGLEQRVEERTRELKGRKEQLEAIADLARSIATIQEADQLLPEITRQVSERFGFYHVGIFLLDDNKQFAILRAANSEGGQKMLARKHRLGVGKQGIVGYVTSQGQARVALDVGEEAVYFDNPDLPNTRSEVALPLKFGQEIIGALDIQSIESNAFSQEDVDTFSILADQISVAIQNAQSQEQAQRALREADSATRQVTGQAWLSFSRNRVVRGFHFDGSSSQPLKETVKVAEDGLLKIPVQIHGQQIANLMLEASEPGYQWSKDEITMIQATAERVALALESARLLEEAERRAVRESIIGEITSRINASTDIDTILRSAVAEIGRQIHGTKVALELIPQTETEQVKEDA